MTTGIPRAEILSRLSEQIRQERPILGAGCSAGLIAKCGEQGGADLIVLYSTGKTRIMGLPTTLITGTSNPITLSMFEEIANVVKTTPLIAGIEANDFFCLDLEASLRRFVEKGFSGAINFPTVGLYENLLEGGMALRKYTEAMAPGYGVSHWGWSREVEMIHVLRTWDVFTLSYVFTASDAVEMARAGVDAVCVHVGPSMGGLTGYAPLEDAEALLVKAQQIMNAARKVRPDVICLIHGGPFHDPESTKIVYEKTDAVRFVAASAIERVPVEKAVMEECRQYKTLPMPRTDRT